MKLRNKKTGEIVTFVTLEEIYDDELDFTYIKKSGNENELSYSSFKKFNDEWEDYVPKEPLIKDEKIRKAVRTWADATGIEKVTSYGDYFWIGFVSKNTVSDWKFECNYKGASEFKHDKEYTIAELCGEEEE